MQIGDVTFCNGDSSSSARLFAIAIEARVDIFNLSQPEENPEYSDDDDALKPRTQLNKFNDTTTSINFRQDGNLLVAGEKTGRIQLFELNNKFVLR